MSHITLKKWMDEFNQLLTDLTKKLQLSVDKAEKSREQQLEGLEQYKFLQLNQMVNNNQDLFVMKYIDDQFCLSHFMYSSRYNESPCKVKLVESISEKEIPQQNYRNSIFEFCISDNKAYLLIKQLYKGNASFKMNDQIMIKEVFVGHLQADKLTLSKINNIDACSQVAFHPLNNKYLLILQTTQLWNRYHTHQSDQYFYVYETHNSKQPKLRLNLQTSMNGEAQSFCFSTENDENELFLYFINSFGEIYYFNLILPGMVINVNTKLYLKTYFPQIANFTELKQQSDLFITYDCTKSDEFTNNQIKFNLIQQQNYHVDSCQTLIVTKMQIKDYHLFIVICQLFNGNLIIQTLIGEDLKKIYEIYKEEIPIKSNESKYSKHNEPKIVNNKNNVTHLAQNQFDLPNRYQLIVSYNNSLIIVDYSNVIQFRQDQSPINVTCLELNHSLQIGKNKESIQQYLINQALCLDLFNTKSLLIKAITKEGKSSFYLLSHKILLSLTEPNQELNKIALEFYQEKNAFQLNKQALKSLKSKLKQIREQQISQCKTEEDIIKLNEDLQNNFVNSINRIAIRIKLESENMFNDIDLKLKGDLQQQAKKNIELQQKIFDKNEKINSLLEKLKVIPQPVIYQQLKNLQKRADLEQYESQFQHINSTVMQSKTQLQEEIQKSQRYEQDIRAIETNLIHQIQAQKNKRLYIYIISIYYHNLLFF